MKQPIPPLILASSSPRRKQLLEEVGLSFTVVPPSDTAESGVIQGESADQLVARLAFQKACDVAGGVTTGLVLGGDTVAACAGRILGKPRDEKHAREMLELMRGREHTVHSGVCLWLRPGDRHLVRVATTTLLMEPISNEQLREYLVSKAWEGKAGAFGYQDGLDWVHLLQGSESNVVGLPLELLGEMLREFEIGM